MSQSNHTQSITAEDLRLFLALWPKLSAEADEAHEMLIEGKDMFLGKDAKFSAWCHLYELPIKQHLALANAGIVEGYGKFLSTEHFADWYKQLVNTPGQIGALPDIVNQINNHFDAITPSKTEAAELLPNMAMTFGLGLSMYHALRCVLYHGCFLNELVEHARAGSDKALFKAVRIDPTVIGCPSVIQRISTATILKEEDFFKKLKNAINGKPTKREQANYQMMRLVLEVLHEAGATRLNDEQLYQLFVEELDLYPWNDVEGGNPEALRKFADTYMKKNATT